VSESDGRKGEVIQSEGITLLCFLTGLGFAVRERFESLDNLLFQILKVLVLRAIIGS
jgi:hypothetical protein